jgi:hypothetical protein
MNWPTCRYSKRVFWKGKKPSKCSWTKSHFTISTNCIGYIHIRISLIDMAHEKQNKTVSLIRDVLNNLCSYGVLTLDSSLLW